MSLPARYQVDREIGRGGMAVVYRAHDQHLDRSVAIKVLSTDLSDIAGGERFEREISVLARLVHPNIVALFDAGNAGGHRYYVMPFVEGDTLRARLQKDRRLAPQTAAALGADVAEALAYAHGAGVVHRDVKPENIFIVAGRAILGDFGVAQVSSDGPHPDAATVAVTTHVVLHWRRKSRSSGTLWVTYCWQAAGTQKPWMRSSAPSACTRDTDRRSNGWNSPARGSGRWT